MQPWRAERMSNSIMSERTRCGGSAFRGYRRTSLQSRCHIINTASATSQARRLRRGSTGTLDGTRQIKS
jgi:hypothetical protein